MLLCNKEPPTIASDGPPAFEGRYKNSQIDTYTNTTLTGSYTSKTIKYNYGNDGKTGWSYLLTSYDADSDNVVDTNEKISYDAIGNPTTYRGATLSWYGRQLTDYVNAAKGIDYSFTYDADGLRNRADYNGRISEFQYVGDKLFYEKRGDGNSFYYFYDSYGKLSVIYHYVNGTRVPYHVVTNAQGDVVALYNWSGTKVAEYSYDAWGNCTIVSDTSSTSIATLNPFRYRSYYYDTDLSLYYLQSRYYDSAIGRFINADGQISGIGGSVQGYNMYSYCMNNPVNMTDESGNWPNWRKLISGISLAVTGMTAVAAVATATCIAAPVAIAVGLVGAACMVMSSSEITEAFTDYNLVKDKVFNENEQAYNVARTVVSTAASLGTGYVNSVTGPGNIPVCFVAGTYILAHLRNKKIEDIRVGDKVWAENPETGEKELKTVVQTFVNETNELVHVFVNGEEIITTPNHPFYVPQKGWVSAIKLRAGDILVLHNGKYVIIEQTQHELLENPVTVYNFEVEDFHTYYVGESSVLVHNANCKQPARGIGGKGWEGDQTWRENVSRVASGGTITSLNGGIPTIAQAIQLIEEAGGSSVRTDKAHDAPNPHNYSHINYVTSSGTKGTIKVLD